MVIAIDGPAGAGKSTVARGVAAALGFTYLDSGAMYRSVALAALRAGVDPDDAESVTELARGLEIAFDGQVVLLDTEDVSQAIRSPDVSEAASFGIGAPRRAQGDGRAAKAADRRRALRRGRP